MNKNDENIDDTKLLKILVIGNLYDYSKFFIGNGGIGKTVLISCFISRQLTENYVPTCIMLF